MSHSAPSAPPPGCVFAVVDLETSGLRADSDSILQVAIVHQDLSGERLGEWSTYVRPASRWRSSLGPVEIHGIRRRHVILAPPLDRVMTAVATAIHGCIVVAHNAAFDLGFLRVASTRTNVPLSHSGSLCTLQLSRSLGERGQANHKLASLCSEFGVDPGRAHHALDDARATGAILPHLLARLGVTTLAELEPHVRR